MPGGLLGVFGNKLLEVGFGRLVFFMSGSRPPIGGCEFSPAVGRAHVDRVDRL